MKPEFPRDEKLFDKSPAIDVRGSLPRHKQANECADQRLMIPSHGHLFASGAISVFQINWQATTGNTNANSHPNNGARHPGAIPGSAQVGRTPLQVDIIDRIWASFEVMISPIVRMITNESAGSMAQRDDSHSGRSLDFMQSPDCRRPAPLSGEVNYPVGARPSKCSIIIISFLRLLKTTTGRSSSGKN
jgi:hypothetical protein